MKQNSLPPKASKGQKVKDPRIAPISLKIDSLMEKDLRERAQRDPIAKGKVTTYIALQLERHITGLETQSVSILDLAKTNIRKTDTLAAMVDVNYRLVVELLRTYLLYTPRIPREERVAAAQRAEGLLKEWLDGITREIASTPSVVSSLMAGVLHNSTSSTKDSFPGDGL